MTEVLWIALGMMGAVSAFTLALVFVLLNRLNRLTAQVAEMSQPMMPDLPPLGPVPEFTATTTTGESISSTDLAGAERYLIFLYGSCESCHDHLPELVGQLAGLARRPVAVVIGRPDTRANLTAGLTPVAHVIEEYDMSSLANLFQVSGFPSYLRISHGQIVAVGHGFRDVRATSAAMAGVPA